MDNLSENSPTCVATELLSDRVGAKELRGPPLGDVLTMGEPVVAVAAASLEWPRPDGTANAGSDDGDAPSPDRRWMMADFRGLSASVSYTTAAVTEGEGGSPRRRTVGDLPISEWTCKFIDGMDKDQVEEARQSLEEVTDQRRKSSRFASQQSRQLCDARRRSGRKPSAESQESLLRHSMFEFDEGELSDDTEGTGLLEDFPVVGRKISKERVLSKSLGAMYGGSYILSEAADNDIDEGGESLETICRQLKVVNEKRASQDHDFGREGSRCPNTRQRRRGTLSKSCSAAGEPKRKWKLPRSNQDPETPLYFDKDDDKSRAKTAASKQRVAGGVWNWLPTSLTNSLTDSFNAERVSSSATVPGPREKKDRPKKEVSGAAYFRRGKRKKAGCQILQAVALFGFALDRQRENLGENHLDCAKTLNEIGVCWMMLGERYPALTAFEEALYIRQKHLGHGAMEVAETTNNIWMILHEERLEIEGLDNGRGLEACWRKKAGYEKAFNIQGARVCQHT